MEGFLDKHLEKLAAASRETASRLQQENFELKHQNIRLENELKKGLNAMLSKQELEAKLNALNPLCRDNELRAVLKSHLELYRRIENLASFAPLNTQQGNIHDPLQQLETSTNAQASAHDGGANRPADPVS